MEKQDAGQHSDVGSGKGQVAFLQSPGQNGQSKGKDDAQAFQTKQGIILNKPLFLADI